MFLQSSGITWILKTDIPRDGINELQCISLQNAASQIMILIPKDSKNHFDTRILLIVSWISGVWSMREKKVYFNDCVDTAEWVNHVIFQKWERGRFTFMWNADSLGLNMDNCTEWVQYHGSPSCPYFVSSAFVCPRFSLNCLKIKNVFKYSL